MHILVTNDDGPPSASASPYILPFVSHLSAAGHLVSVVVPDSQRSWIAKAHIVGQDVKATPYTPPSYTLPASSRTTSTGTDTAAAAGAVVTEATKQPKSWWLVNSTPASCAQLGLHHLLPVSSAAAGGDTLPPIDLVVSGPNYGRNTTAVFALSSGTMGAALEAAVTGYKAIALSFAFTNRDNDPEIVAESCRHSVRVVEWLYANGKWDAPCKVKQAGASVEAESRGNPGGVVFSVNVPVSKGVEGRATEWTELLQNTWGNSCFVEGEGTDGWVATGDGAAEVESDIRSHEVDGGQAGKKEEENGKEGERHFKWSPRFTDVYESVRRAGEGSDGWAVSEGRTSVTMLRANFMHIEGVKGELKL